MKKSWFGKAKTVITKQKDSMAAKNIWFKKSIHQNKNDFNEDDYFKHKLRRTVKRMVHLYRMGEHRRAHCLKTTAACRYLKNLELKGVPQLGQEWTEAKDLIRDRDCRGKKGKKRPDEWFKTKNCTYAGEDPTGQP